ncbi:MULTISPECIES: hypothetical protein [unclassified Streptomyces]|uniref:hypothetical protein n=1 Tax=unclassified Streptomyces TaxID=2593676 RepID=UPI00093A3439|nr:hypothetical protein [Streptomyces sp. CB02058]OKI95654.1 hypothetical protein AMK10_08090 [Streptomyces sp. CB02058]
MADETGLRDQLADLAESGGRRVVPLAAEGIRARGEQRLHRRRAALASGGALLAVVLAVGGMSLLRAPGGSEPPATGPAPTASSFVPPTPGPGAEYATELGYVYGAAAEGDTVRVTVRQVRTVRGAAEPTDVVHTLTLPRGTLAEVRELADGKPGDTQLDALVDRLGDQPQWVFAIDYDTEGRVQSLREAYWLSG